MVVTGQHLGHFEIEAVAGSGGMGVVYRARDRRLGRRVALKVIAPQHAQDPRMRERLNRESMILAGLDHPNTLPLYEIGEADGALFLASRWVEGHTLDALVGDRGPLEPNAAVEVVAQVAAALEAAHSAGLVHRDVKPPNVLIAHDGHVYLGDFGVARRATDALGLTETHELLGSLDYVAPEQIQGLEAGPRSDVYALGGVLHFALTGELPFPTKGYAAKVYAHLSADPPSPRGVRPDVPEGLDALVRRAMAKDPDERPASAAEFAAAARQAIGASRPPARDGDEDGDAPGGVPRTRLDAIVEAARRADDEAERQDAAVPARSRRRPRRREAEGAVSAGATVAARDRADAQAGPRPRRRWGRGLLLGLVLVLLAAIPAVLLGLLLRDEAAGAQTVSVAPAGSSIAAAHGRLWVSARGSSRLVGVPVDDLEGPRRTIDAGAGVSRIAGRPDRLVVGVDRAVLDVDDPSAERARRRTLPFVPETIAVGARAIWVAARDSRVLLRLQSDGTAARTRTSAPISGVAVAGDVVWVSHAGNGTVGRLDAGTGEPLGVERLGGRPAAIAATSRAAWVVDAERDAVLRLDPETGREAAPAIGVPGDPVAVAADAREVWVVRRGDDAVTRLDARTGRPLDELGVPPDPVDVALTDDAAWVLSAGGELTRLPRQPVTGGARARARAKAS